MKPYFVWHDSGIAFGFGIGKVAPVGQWDISLSLLFFTIGLRQKYEITQQDLDNAVNGYLKKWDEEHERL